MPYLIRNSQNLIKDIIKLRLRSSPGQPGANTKFGLPHHHPVNFSYDLIDWFQSGPVLNNVQDDIPDDFQENTQNDTEQSVIKKEPWYHAVQESYQGSQEKDKSRIGLLVDPILLLNHFCDQKTRKLGQY